MPIRDLSSWQATTNVEYDDYSVMRPPSASRRIANALRRGTEGVGESALSLGSGLAAAPVGGVTGLITKALGGSDEEAAHDMEHMSSALTYEPKTPGGRSAVEGWGKLLELPHRAGQWLGEHAQDAGMGPLLAAGIATGGELGLNELIPKVKKLPKGHINWEAMTHPEAEAFAAANKHLRSSNANSAGKYVGAPAWIKNKRDLNKLRSQIDAAVKAGKDIPIDAEGSRTGKDWYPEGREANAALTSSPENASQLADLEAVYSPQKSVPTSVELVLKHKTLEALHPSDDAASKMSGGLPDEPFKAQAIMAGHRGALSGQKVEPFAGALDPFREQPPVNTVNDSRMGGFFGYESNSYHPTQYSFMTGEMHAALARAKKAGVLPKDADAHSVQAAVWSSIPGRGGEMTAEGLGSMLRKHGVNVTHEPGSPGMPGHLEGLNDNPMSIRREHADNMSWADPQGQDIITKAMGMPQSPVTKGMGNWSSERPGLRPLEASIMDPKTGEIFGGNKAGHMHSDAYMGMDPDAMARFDEHPETFMHGFTGPEGQFLTRSESTQLANALKKEPGNDPRLGRAGLYFEQHPDRAAGITTSPAASEDFRGIKPSKKPAIRIEHNPEEVAHPLLPYDDATTKDYLHQTETFRSGMSAQKAYGWNRVRELPAKQHYMSNALKLEKLFDSEMTSPERDLATRSLFNKTDKAGLQLLDNGGGNFTLTGKEFADTSPSNFQDLLGKMDPNSETTEMLQGLGKKGTLDAGYGENPNPGEGALTEHMLNAISPHVAGKLHTPEISAQLLKMNEAERLADMSNRGALKSGPRADLQKLRGMTAEHGLEGVRAAVEEKMADSDGRLTFKQAAASLGLPAYLIMALGGDDER